MLFATRGISILRSKSLEPHILKKALTDGVAEHQGPAAKIPRCSERSPASCGVLLYDGGDVTRTPVRAVRVQAYVRTGSRTIRSIRFIAMIPAVFTCKLTTLFP